MGNQYCFLKALIRKEALVIKVEVIQNIPLLDPVETLEGTLLLSQKDIGLLKLMSASNRKARKDIYDLDYLSDHLPLEYLLSMLEEKQARYNSKEFKCLFDLDNEESPTENLSLLLAFDNIDYGALPYRPNHSNDIIDIISPNKTWMSARLSWKRKVRNLMHTRGIDPPAIKPVN